MKQSLVRHRSSKLSGFTLVELLVVIGIIAILASVLMVAAGSALNAAKRAKAGSMANQIQTSALAYYTEYSVYPVPTGSPATDYTIGDAAANDAAWGNLICSLCGNNNPSTGMAFTTSTVPNTRGIAFLSMKSVDVDANGTPKNPLPTGTSIYFNIAIDNDYDGILGTAPSTVPLPNFTTATVGAAPPMTGSCTSGVAVWANCNGKATSQNPNWWVKTY